jgi:hypothetical protein
MEFLTPEGRRPIRNYLIRRRSERQSTPYRSGCVKACTAIWTRKCVMVCTYSLTLLDRFKGFLQLLVALTRCTRRIHIPVAWKQEEETAARVGCAPVCTLLHEDSIAVRLRLARRWSRIVTAPIAKDVESDGVLDSQRALGRRLCGAPPRPSWSVLVLRRLLGIRHNRVKHSCCWLKKLFLQHGPSLVSTF